MMLDATTYPLSSSLYRRGIHAGFFIHSRISREQHMKFHHICNCGRHFHCGNEIVHYFCEECGAEYLGPDCDVTRVLPVDMQQDGKILCQNCIVNTEVIFPEYGT